MFQEAGQLFRTWISVVLLVKPLNVGAASAQAREAFWSHGQHVAQLIWRGARESSRLVLTGQMIAAGGQPIGRMSQFPVLTALNLSCRETHACVLGAADPFRQLTDVQLVHLVFQGT
jgi:hypothetical protein